MVLLSTLRKKKTLKSTPAQLKAASNYYKSHTKDKIKKVLLNRRKRHPWFSFQGHFDIVYEGLIKTAKREKLTIYPKDKFWEETKKDYAELFNCWEHFNFHYALRPIFDLDGSAWTGRWWMHKKMIHPETGKWTNPIESSKSNFCLFSEDVFMGTKDEQHETYRHLIRFYRGEKCEEKNCKFTKMLRPMDEVYDLMEKQVNEPL